MPRHECGSMHFCTCSVFGVTTPRWFELVTAKAEPVIDLMPQLSFELPRWQGWETRYISAPQCYGQPWPPTHSFSTQDRCPRRKPEPASSRPGCLARSPLT
jgi:hypothetical protein